MSALGAAYALSRALVAVTSDPDAPGALTADSIDVLDGAALLVWRLAEGLARRDTTAGYEAAGLDVPEAAREVAADDQLDNLVALFRAVSSWTAR